MKSLIIDDGLKDLIVGQGLRVMLIDNFEVNPQIGETMRLDCGDESYFIEITQPLNHSILFYQFKLLPTMVKDGEAYLVIGTEPNNARSIQDLIPEHSTNSRMFIKPVEIPVFDSKGKFIGEIGIQGLRLRGDHLGFLHVSYRHGNMGENISHVMQSISPDKMTVT